MDETTHAKLLIIDDDPDTLRLVELMLERQGYQVLVATSGKQGLSKASEAPLDLILLDAMMPGLDGYQVARQLRERPATANIPILMFTAKSQLEDQLAGFEAGVDDYLTKPTHPSELLERVRILLTRSTGDRSAEASGKPDQHGCVIAVLSARGGSGVSSLSLNLGASLMVRDNSEVIVAELTPGQGTLALDLGLPNPRGLTQILNSLPSEITRQMVEQTLVDHESGLHLLLASYKPGDVSLLGQVDQFQALLPHLTAQAGYVVLDFGHGLPTLAQRLLPICDRCLILVEGVPNSIIHTRELIEDIVSLGVDKEQITAVLNNRVRSDIQLSLAQVEEKLGHPIGVAITPAPELFLLAVQYHTAAILAQPESLTDQQYAKLADLITKREAQAG
jgi:DNA-binding response OmpR family regulator